MQDYQDKARLKVRPARPRLESQGKAQDRQAQHLFSLQVRKLETEAGEAARLCLSGTSQKNL